MDETPHAIAPGAGFNDTFISGRIDPLYEQNFNFDWDDLFARLGEAEQHTGPDYEKMGQALKILLCWTLEPSGPRAFNNVQSKLRRAGIRMAALLWVLDPSVFDGTPSASTLSAILGFNSRQEFSEHTSKFTRRFGVQNRGQSHGRSGRHSKRLSKKGNAQ